MNNLDMMRKRLGWQGGTHQEDRMIKDKWRTFQRTLLYSYQACTVMMIQKYNTVLPAETKSEALDSESPQCFRALINPDKLKQEYDDKVLSIDYDTGFEPGDIFQWAKTDTHWIIYTQQLTEDAYFRGEIRRCRHIIKFKDDDGNVWCTWAAIRGPIETQIDSIQKNQERVDEPNLSLNILMPQNPITKQAFERYKEFIFNGRCWRVKAHDMVSMKNVIEVNAEEYYLNKETDDLENEIVDGLIIEPVDPTPDSGIDGLTFIKPRIPSIYSVDAEDGAWKVSDNAPVTITPIDEKTISITWDKMISGQFTLYWLKNTDTKEKTIVVESLY